MDLVLHHIVTIFLYVFSYLTNEMVGPVIALLHDIGDIGVAWTRTWAESDYPKVAGYSFAVTVATWGYTRLYLLTYYIYVVAWR
jgi:ceramide synthetase